MCNHFFDGDVMVWGFEGVYDVCSEELIWVIVLGGRVYVMV